MGTLQKGTRVREHLQDGMILYKEDVILPQGPLCEHYGHPVAKFNLKKKILFQSKNTPHAISTPYGSKSRQISMDRRSVEFDSS